jgi:hypothetical protein
VLWFCYKILNMFLFALFKIVLYSKCENIHTYINSSEVDEKDPWEDNMAMHHCSWFQHADPGILHLSPWAKRVKVAYQFILGRDHASVLHRVLYTGVLKKNHQFYFLLKDLEASLCLQEVLAYFKNRSSKKHRTARTANLLKGLTVFIASLNKSRVIGLL